MAKERTASEALRSLMARVPDGDEVLQNLYEFGDAPWVANPDRDRTAAIMSAAHLEIALRRAISKHFVPDPDDPDHKYVFGQSQDAPYQALSSRIRLARALGIVDKKMYDQLNTVRDIRNLFAHAPSVASFAHPAIAPNLEKLSVLPETEVHVVATQATFGRTLLTMATADKANRMAFTLAVLSFYWKLAKYELPTGSECPSS